MAIDPQLSSFMPHTVTIAAFTSKNNYGEDSVGSTRTAKAYVEPSIVLDQSVQTNEQHPATTAYIADTNIGIRDRITLPDGSNPEIVSIAVHTEVVGLEHTVVTFA